MNVLLVDNLQVNEAMIKGVAAKLRTAKPPTTI